MANFPVTPFRNLPEATNLSSGSINLVGVEGNTRTVRIKFADLTDGFVTMARQEPTTPESSSAGDIYITYSGLLSHEVTSGWGKSPRYTAHWDDLTPGVRFLYVNDVMGMNPTELGNARTSLNIHTATADDPGLVKATPIQQTDTQDATNVRVTSDGTAVVPYATPTEAGVVRIGAVPTIEYSGEPARDHAAVTRAYLEYRFDHLRTQQKFPVATYSTMGGIIPAEEQFLLSGDSGEFLGLREATEPDYRFSDPDEYSSVPARGVKLAYSTPYSSLDDQGTLSDVDLKQVTTVERVRAEVNHKIAAVRGWRAGYSGPGTDTGFGLVALAADGAIIAPDENDPGRIDVRPASGMVYGAVTVANSVVKDNGSGAYSSDGQYPAVTTPTAVYSYVEKRLDEKFSDTELANWALQTFPPPTYSTRGVAAIDGSTIQVQQNAAFSVPQLYVPKATNNSDGVVRLANSFSSLAPGVSYAATPDAVINYVDSAVSSYSWNGGEVEYSATFKGGAYDATEYSESYEYADDQLVTYGKVQSMLSSGDAQWSGGSAYTNISMMDGAKLMYAAFSDYSFYSDGDVLPKLYVEAAVYSGIEDHPWGDLNISGKLNGYKFSTDGITFPGDPSSVFADYSANAVVPRVALGAEFNKYLPKTGGSLTSGKLTYAGSSSSTWATYTNNDLVPKKAVSDGISGMMADYLPLRGGTLNSSATIQYSGSNLSDYRNYSTSALLPKSAVVRLVDDMGGGGGGGGGDSKWKYSDLDFYPTLVTPILDIHQDAVVASVNGVVVANGQDYSTFSGAWGRLRGGTASLDYSTYGGAVLPYASYKNAAAVYLECDGRDLHVQTAFSELPLGDSVTAYLYNAARLSVTSSSAGEGTIMPSGSQSGRLYVHSARYDTDPSSVSYSWDYTGYTSLEYSTQGTPILSAVVRIYRLPDSGAFDCTATVVHASSSYGPWYA